MSGLTAMVDTLLATRLAQRVDLVPLKPEVAIAGPGAVTPVEEVANDVRLASRAAGEQQLGVGPLKSNQRGHGNAAAQPGEVVTLSAAARTLGTILNSQDGAAAKVAGVEPIFSRTQPPVAAVLADSLAQTVANSGLFYESHLAQFAAGTRTLAQLMQEPQAQLHALAGTFAPVVNADAATPILLAAALANAVVHGASAALEAPALPVTAPALAAPADAGDLSIPTSGPVPADLASGPAQAYSLAGSAPASLRDHALVQAAGAELAHPEASGKSQGAGTAEAARNNAPNFAGIHPDAMALVRQQLELLAAPVFRWGGEAWPGVPMDWDIHEDDQPRANADDKDASPRSWRTRLTLTLPTLKDVEVRISLAGSTLQVQLSARENATLAVLKEAGGDLPARLDAQGLQLAELRIGMLAPSSTSPTAPDSPKADDGK